MGKRIIILMWISLSVVLSTYAQTTEELKQAILQKHKEAFFASDSADVLANDLGKIRHTVHGALDNTAFDRPIPYVVKLSEKGNISMDMPCGDEETDEYYYVSVLAQHNNLDSALVLAKVKGVDVIFQFEGYSYDRYMREAEIACVTVRQIEDLFYVNAAIRFPKTTFVVNEKVLKRNMRKLNKESIKRSKPKSHK